jgi:hypothetical protein
VFEGALPSDKNNCAAQFLQTIPNLKTRSRYASSVNNMKPRFGKLRLPQITSDRIRTSKKSAWERAWGLQPLTGIWRHSAGCCGSQSVSDSLPEARSLKSSFWKNEVP